MRLSREEWVLVLQAEALCCPTCGGDGGWVTSKRPTRASGRRRSQAVRTWVRCMRCKPLRRMLVQMGSPLAERRPHRVGIDRQGNRWEEPGEVVLP